MNIPLRFMPLAAAAMLAFSGCASLDGLGLGDDDTSDDGIAATAASRLNGDSMTASATLSVAVENGMATLYGTVPNEMTRQRAIQILKDTPGIFDVLDRTRKF